MPHGQYVFSQLMDHMPLTTFRRCVVRYNGERKVQHFSCLDQFRCLAFAQLTWRESLRDIEACLNAQASKLYRLGFRTPIIARNTMSNANAVRDWRIYADFAQHVIGMARELYAGEALPDLEGLDTVYALISRQSICACPFFHGLRSVQRKRPSSCTRCSIFAAASPRSSTSATARLVLAKAGMHDVRVLDLLQPEPGAFYVMDRGYLDFERLARLANAGSFFITTRKSNTRVRRRYSRPVDRWAGSVCDQTVVLTGYYTRKGFDSPLRRVKFNDPETGKTLVFLSNKFALPAMTIAKLYKYRWKVELFFKWIKQHLRIKAFFGETENAVKTQIWSAICVYVLVAIVKKRLGIKASLYEMLQILSLTLFEKKPAVTAPYRCTIANIASTRV